MTKREAISVLGGQEELVEEYITQEVFELKTNLLKGVLVPQVMTKKAEKLFLMADALIVLGYQDEHMNSLESDLKLSGDSVRDLLAFFRDYEQKMSKLKLLLMQAFHPRIVAQLLLFMSNLEHNKCYEIRAVFHSVSEDTSVKLSDFIDSGIVISELKTHPDTDKISDNLALFPTLKKEINKSLKYCKFADAKKSR